jgi:dual specificity tyrosine-phosphorylation-regulated kinase 2/3/4
MMEIKGVPADYIIELSTRRNLFFEKDSFFPIIVTNSRGRKRIPNTKTLKSVLRKCADTKFLDFIDQCLDWDPVNRMTPLESL